MRADLEELLSLLSDSHPDPYRGAGGAVAFHRLAGEVAQSLPRAASRDEFLRILRPLVAAVRDGHTAIGTAPGHAPATATATAAHPWLDWDVVGEDIYVCRVYEESQRTLLGCRLLAVDGVPLPELKARMAALHGCDNEMDVMRRLAEALRQQQALLALLAQNEPPQSTHFELATRDGMRATVEMRWTTVPAGPPITPPSRLSPPPLGISQLGWGFLDAEHTVACLRVGELMSYREAFEVWLHRGFTSALAERLRDLLPDASPEEPVERLIAKVPSATGILCELVAAMRQGGVRALVVDLREAIGGNSALAHILGCFLFGEEEMALAEEGYQIRRYSPLYRENYGALPEGANLANGGYDFREEQAFRDRRASGMTLEGRAQALAAAEEYAKAMPSFAAARADLSVGPVPRLAVVTSAFTYSAGFDVAAMLARRGALHVGVPSAQAGNCFIDILRFRLSRSGLVGTISFKESFLFPDDPDAGYLLRPQRELTYEFLAAQDFDPHAGLCLALEM